MVKTFTLIFYMIITWTKSRYIQITTIFKFLNFAAVFTQSRAHLLDGIDREWTFQVKTLNSLSMSTQDFLCMNTDSWVNSTILILLALNIRSSYEWLFQNLRMKYGGKSVGWDLSDGRNTHERATFINPFNSVF